MEKPKPYPFDHRKAVRHLKRADARLAELIERAGRFRMKLDTHETPFQALTEAIIYQQLHGKAAATILERVKARVGRDGFPRPEEILAAEDEQLRGAGLSRQKIAALRDLAEKTSAGIVPSLDAIREMRDEEIIERLTQVRGVGQWTVEMLLIFRLGRPDVLPASDYGVRQGFKLAYRKRKLPKPKELLAYGERWQPYRSVASWYLWQAVHLARSKKINPKAR